LYVFSCPYPGDLRPGDQVNIERSARYGDEMGGHAMSGRVDAAIEIIAVDEPENNLELSFRLPLALVPYHLKRRAVSRCGERLLRLN
jgi:riboflavin synthase